MSVTEICRAGHFTRDAVKLRYYGARLRVPIVLDLSRLLSPFGNLALFLGSVDFFAMLLVQFLRPFRLYAFWILFAGLVFHSLIGFLSHAIESFTGSHGLHFILKRPLGFNRSRPQLGSGSGRVSPPPGGTIRFLLFSLGMIIGTGPACGSGVGWSSAVYVRRSVPLVTGLELKTLAGQALSCGDCCGDALYLSAATLIEEVAKEVSFLSVSASSSNVV